MNMYRHQELQKIFPKATYVNIEKHVNVLRLNKSRQEIDYLQEAVDIIEKVLTEGLKTVKIGMTELELAGQFELLMKIGRASCRERGENAGGTSGGEAER